MKKKFYFFFTFFVLIVLITGIGFVNPKTSSSKVDKKIYTSIEKNDKTNVIILLNDNYLDKKENIYTSSGIDKKIERKKIKEFTSFNGFSDKLSYDEIEKLSNNPYVEKIYYDSPVELFLRDTVNITHTNDTWALQTNNVNLTGKGQTVCIIDTGVNYSHPDLGGCTITNLSLSGNQIDLSTPIESTHNYSNSFQYTWKINYTNFSQIAVHFVNLSTEIDFDYIDIFNGNNILIATYSGFKRDFWSPSVEGDTIYIRLTTDENIRDYGFFADKIINGTTNLTYNWSGCNKVIGGWDIYNSDPDPMDDNGHGTHVAGIVGANGNIKGIAPQTNIFAIKVFPAEEQGTTTDSNIIKGIEWCVNKSEEYNISVISMSLGGGLYSSYCDASQPLYTSAINSAVIKNISVVIAAGNDGSSTQISAPACIQNAIPIGSIRKDDLTIDYNRNSLVKLLAPGYLIYSTSFSGGYVTYSGTSMATPHVSGAIAILNQYLKSSENTKTPSEIEDILWRKGHTIIEGANNFSRIDIYSAIMEIDSTNPEVNLSSPANNTISQIDNQTFVCNATDWQLKNITLHIWNSMNELVNVSSQNVSGTINSSSFNITNIQTGTYKWNCLATDEKGNMAFAANNFTLSIGGIFITLISPQNYTHTKINENYFNCRAASSTDRILKNLTFFIYENGILANTSFTNLTGSTNSSTFNYTFVNQTNYVWGCEAYSNNSDYEAENYSIFYDINYPNITVNSQTVTTSQVTISWNTSEETNYSITLQDYQNASFSSIHSLTITGLIASTAYTYNLTYCDRAGNCNLTEESFTTADTPVITSSGGGGGGGGSTQTKITETQITQGYNKKYSAGEKVSFVSRGQNHSLQLNKIMNNSINVTLRSEPINLVMQSGEEKKINLSSIEYYDLYIKVENVTKYNANITIKGIEELINLYKIVEYENETFDENKTNNENVNKTFGEIYEQYERNLFPLYATLIILVCAFFYFLLKNKFASKKEEKDTKKE